MWLKRKAQKEDSVMYSQVQDMSATKAKPLERKVRQSRFKKKTPKL